VKTLKSLSPYLLFLLSITIFSVLFYLQRHFMTNFDENDHLAVGYFLTNGRLLYKDIFSHHFPFPYYWTYLFTPFWSPLVLSRTIAIFRLSVLVLYLLNSILVFLSYKNFLSKFCFSAWIILLSVFFSLYHGNLVLSETFSAIFIGSIFWIVLPIILGWEEKSKVSTILLILFSSLAFWTQPLLIELSLLPILLSPKNKYKTLIAVFLFNLIPIICFYFSGQLFDFWQQGVLFNFFVYPKFFVDNLPPGNRVIESFLYFLQNELYLFTHLGSYTKAFQFIVHLSFYFLSYKIVKTKNLPYIFSFFLLFIATRVREVKIIPGEIFNFGIYPYLIIATSSLVISIFGFKKNRSIHIFIPYFLTLFIALLDSRPIIIQSLKPNYNYDVFWSYRQRLAETIDKLSSPQEKILVYPHDVDYYALSNRLSPDRFVYWFPWINSVDQYRQERITALDNVDIPLIYIGNLDFKGISGYYFRYFPNLTTGYIPVIKEGKNTGLWIKKSYQDRLKNL